jgi:uncharacterized protein YxjI
VASPGPSSGQAAIDLPHHFLLGDTTMALGGQTYVLNQKLFSLGGDAWIEDEAGNHAFEVDGKAFSLRRTLEIRDPAGASLYTIN